MLSDKCECFLNAYSGHLDFNVRIQKYASFGPRLTVRVALVNNAGIKFSRVCVCVCVPVYLCVFTLLW